MKNNNQDKLYGTTMDLITKLAKMPVVKVNRDEFLRKTYADSPYLGRILENGPQSVYKLESIKLEAKDIVKNSTSKATLMSFAAGIPANPAVMIPAGGVDVVQFYAVALNMAQQIAYLFGEADMFDQGADGLSEDDQMRIVGLLAGMSGVSEASTLISETSRAAGGMGAKGGASGVASGMASGVASGGAAGAASGGAAGAASGAAKGAAKGVASGAAKSAASGAARGAAKGASAGVAKGVGRRVAGNLGRQVSKQGAQKTVTKVVPLLGGIVSGGLTYVTFKPMGDRLIDIYMKRLSGAPDEKRELSSSFIKELEHPEGEWK